MAQGKQPTKAPHTGGAPKRQAQTHPGQLEAERVSVPSDARRGGVARANKRGQRSRGSETSTRAKTAAQAHQPAPAVAPPPPRFHLSCADAVAWLRTLDDQSVDLLITDPPYESLEKHRAVGTTTRLKHSKASSNDWFKIFPNTRFEELFREVYRVLKKDRHFYLFCDATTMFVAKPIAEAAGFKFWKPLIWDKQKIGMGYHYRSRHEFILFFEKGKRRLNDLGQPDIIEAARIIRGYPTEKPAAVSRVLIEQSSQRGELVVDPFMGSASVGDAALTTERSFLGNDISPNALTIASERLERLGALDHELYTNQLHVQAGLGETF